ncbi:MAG: hypothetical protein ACREIU_08450 [Planctomycetota bacterium]
MFALLNKKPTERLVENVLTLLAHLSRRDAGWDRLVRASVTGKGRCPRPLVKPLRNALRDSSVPGTASRAALSAPLFELADLPRTRTGARPKLRVDVRSRGLLSNQIPALRLTVQALRLDGLDELLRKLGTLEKYTSVRLDFGEVDHAYVLGLTVLAAWARSRKKEVEVFRASGQTQEYLRRIGFEEDLFGHAVALGVVDERTNAEQKAAEFVSVFERHAYVGRDDRMALIVTFAELIENVRRHAGPGAISLAAGQFYRAKRKFHGVVVDTGMGIRESFLAGTNVEAKERIRGGESPLDLACKPLVTSKPVVSSEDPGHAGYGLYVVSELAVRNGGTFHLTSDDGSLFRYRRGFQPRREPRPHSPWKGTIVGVIFDLNELVPCAEVYRSLPPPEGYTVDDFFNA